jgi:2-iminobutanoate/2-iminopropanoate deaminase
MQREIIATPNAPKAPAAYSQAVRANGFVFVSGTLPFDPATGAVVGQTIQEQTRQALTNIGAVLEAAGSSLAQAVSATVLLVDGQDFTGMNEEWVRIFSQEPPARQVTQLPVRIPGVRLSISMIAVAR